MLDVMYELPDQPKKSRFVIDEKVAKGESLFKMPETKSA
jgi:ATP-dependent protease Clp ATPase subunit